MARVCLIVQPIHPTGSELLGAAGFTARMASKPDSATVAREIGDAVAVFTRSAGLDATAMDAAPHLRAIGSHGVGTNAVDVAHATALGIPVFNTPDANRAAVAEHTLALMLAVARRIPDADRATRAVDFDFKYRAPLADLSGKVLGIAGFGGIGSRVAAMAKAAFGMRVLVASRSADPAKLRALGYEAATLDELLARADIVSLHLPLLSQSKHLIGERELRLMKPSALLINTARGGLVDEGALVQALAQGFIAGAGLDVFESEQMPAAHPLLSAPNAVLSPHVGGSSQDALRRTAEQLVERLVAIFEGAAMDVVNPSVWPRRRL
jgi:D-3-phosphoglycerate dehydrogenase / 2-oxoglutarate reductase